VHCLAEAMVEKSASKTHRVRDATRTETALFDEIGLEVCEQCRSRDLRLRQRHGLSRANVDQVLGEPAREIMGTEVWPCFRGTFLPSHST